MIFISKKAIKVTIALLLIPLFVYLFIQTMSLAEDLFYQSHFPNPNKQANNSLSPITSTFTIPSQGTFLLIDLDICMMTVYRDGKPTKTYPVSGGKQSTPSPIGTWKIIGKSDWGEGFGGSWMAFNVPWGKYGIHGTVVPWEIGKHNGSKGCIRMKNKDVNELEKMVTWGTVVHIKYDSIPFRAIKNGNCGSDVLKVQKMLYELNYYHGSFDGKFGSGLEHAVKAFQKTNHFYADGIIGRQTYQEILESLE